MLELVQIKALRLSGKTLSTMIEVPARICRIEDGAEQYASIAAYVNDEYDTDDDPIVEVIDAQAY